MFFPYNAANPIRDYVWHSFPTEHMSQPMMDQWITWTSAHEVPPWPDTEISLYNPFVDKVYSVN